MCVCVCVLCVFHCVYFMCSLLCVYTSMKVSTRPLLMHKHRTLYFKGYYVLCTFCYEGFSGEMAGVVLGPVQIGRLQSIH